MIASGEDVERARLNRARSRAVMIATPIARQPAWQFTLSFAKTLLRFDHERIRCMPQVVIGSSNLPRARNELVATFLASPCDDMLFIDDDMGWDAVAALRLLASDKPVCAVAGRKKWDAPNSDQNVWCGVPDLDAGGYITQDEMGFVRFVHVGTAFMKISREAFQTIAAARPDLKSDGPPHIEAAQRAHYHRFFRFSESELGEDYGFCADWRAMGGEIWVDVEQRLSHVGEKDYSGAFCEIMQAAEPLREAAE